MKGRLGFYMDGSGYQLTNPMNLFLKKDFIYLLLERGEEREKEGEKHQCVVASHTPPTGDLACNPGMYPDWESNRRPCSSQDSTQSTEPHQPGLILSLYCWILKVMNWFSIMSGDIWAETGMIRRSQIFKDLEKDYPQAGESDGTEALRKEWAT